MHDERILIIILLHTIILYNLITFAAKNKFKKAIKNIFTYNDFYRHIDLIYNFFKFLFGTLLLLIIIINL